MTAQAKPKYTKEQYWKMYEQLPQELKEAVFSSETADHIFEICEQNDVQEVATVAAQVGDVLMGVTLPKDFQASLQKELGLKPTVAQKVTHAVNRLVFYPVKDRLEEIHRIPAETKSPTADIGIATPRHGARAARPIDEYMAEQEESEEVKIPTPRHRVATDDYMVETEPASEESEEGGEEPKPREQDTYREPIE